MNKYEEIIFRGLQHYTRVDFHDTWTWEMAYLTGIREPNYLVPVVRTRVTLTKDVVIIWKHHSNRAVRVWVRGERDAISSD